MKSSRSPKDLKHIKVPNTGIFQDRRFLQEATNILRPRQILECGGGLSTKMFLEYCRKSTAYLTTIDLATPPLEIADEDGKTFMVQSGDHTYKSSLMQDFERSDAGAYFQWIQRDCRETVEQLSSDVDYLQNHLVFDTVDMFLEDSVHFDGYTLPLLKSVEPILSDHSMIIIDDISSTPKTLEYLHEHSQMHCVRENIASVFFFERSPECSPFSQFRNFID